MENELIEKEVRKVYKPFKSVFPEKELQIMIDRIKKRKQLNELTLPKKQWTTIQASAIDDRTFRMMFQLYIITYKEIGLHIDDLQKFKDKYKIYWLVDLDADPEPDAFIAYKQTPYGDKIALIGHDGQDMSKKSLIEKCIELLKTKYWYIEASGRVLEIFDSAGVNKITDETTIEKVLGNYDVDMNPDGSYKRHIGSLGQKKKMLMGFINI